MARDLDPSRFLVIITPGRSLHFCVLISWHLARLGEVFVNYENESGLHLNSLKRHRQRKAKQCTNPCNVLNSLLTFITIGKCLGFILILFGDILPVCFRNES